jgi:predicted Zn-dependent protease
VRGGGGVISVVGEDDVLLENDYNWDLNSCIVVHEIAHTMHIHGIQRARPDIETRIQKAAVVASLISALMGSSSPAITVD